MPIQNLDLLVAEWIPVIGEPDTRHLVGDEDWYDLLEGSAWHQSMGMNLTSYVLAQETLLARA